MWNKSYSPKLIVSSFPKPRYPMLRRGKYIRPVSLMKTTTVLSSQTAVSVSQSVATTKVVTRVNETRGGQGEILPQLRAQWKFPLRNTQTPTDTLSFLLLFLNLDLHVSLSQRSSRWIQTQKRSLFMHVLDDRLLHCRFTSRLPVYLKIISVLGAVPDLDFLQASTIWLS